MAFHGKVALVTGGASGMGRLAARRLAAARAQVAILDVNEAGLRETKGDLASIRAIPIDVTDARAVAAAVHQIETELGPIDRVMNAAAIMPTDLLVDQDADLVNRIMAINYGGTVNVTLAVLPGMLARGSGDLVNFASVAGWLPTLHFGAYNASKFAVVAFTEVLYHENRGRGQPRRASADDQHIGRLSPHLRSESRHEPSAARMIRSISKWDVWTDGWRF